MGSDGTFIWNFKSIFRSSDVFHGRLGDSLLIINNTYPQPDKRLINAGTIGKNSAKLEHNNKRVLLVQQEKVFVDLGFSSLYRNIDLPESS